MITLETMWEHVKEMLDDTSGTMVGVRRWDGSFEAELSNFVMGNLSTYGATPEEAIENLYSIWSGKALTEE